MFEWSSKYEIGEGVVDHEHSELFRMVNAIGDRVAAGEGNETLIEARLEELLAYAETHFQNEEDVMHVAGVDVRHIRHQQMEHRSFFYDIKRLRNVTVDDSIDVRYDKLIKFVANWLIFHTLRTDQQLGIQLREIRAGTSPADAFEKAEQMNFSTDIYRPVLDALIHLWSGAMETIHEMEAKAKAR